jgi:hypothetical protein
MPREAQSTASVFPSISTAPLLAAYAACPAIETATEFIEPISEIEPPPPVSIIARAATRAVTKLPVAFTAITRSNSWRDISVTVP